jgi:hypothetical protein
MSFSFNTSRVVPVGAIEAQPADNKGAIVQQFPAQPSGSGEVVDSLLLLADGGALTVEIGVWDTTGETDQWIVVAAKSLADGVPLVIPFPYTGERGVQVYCRATVAPAANVTLRMKQISGGAAPIEVSLAGMATEAKQTELNTYVAPGTWVPASCIPPGDSAVLSASPCVVRSVIASNRTGDTVYMMLFDAASVPADSTAPRLPFIVIPAESTVQVELGGMTCANGLCWSTTTTFGVKTIGSTSPIVVSAELI